MSEQFEGFVPPTKNYFPVPNNWIDICADIRDISELKVIQYVIRHTWGFHEFGICKTISVDEFMHGRRRQDQTRMDKGTGLSEQSVRNGLKKAIKDGYLVSETDPSDAGRIKKSYALRMQANPTQVQTLDPPQTLDPSTGTNFIPQGTNPYTSDSQSLDPRVPNFIPRSEKDTIERHLGKTPIEKEGVTSSEDHTRAPENVTHLHKWKEESGPHKAIVLPKEKGQTNATSSTHPDSVLPPEPRGDALNGHSSETRGQTGGAGSTGHAQEANAQGSELERPAMALTARQIQKQTEQRAEEILVLYGQKIGRKPSRSKANLDGALKLAQDDVLDEDIQRTIDGIMEDEFFAKNLNLTFVYSKIDAFARKKAPKPKDEPVQFTHRQNFTGRGKQLREARRAAGGM